MQILPEWSPDGRHIVYTNMEVFWGDTEVWKASSAGENPERIAVSDGWVARWSRDGRFIYFLRDHNVWRVSAEGGGERQLTDLVGKRGEMGVLSLTTDGRHLYFTWWEDTGDIWVMDVVSDESD